MTPIELDHAKGLNGAIAGELRAERGRQRVTFDALADRTDISRRTLIRLLNGERAINMATLESISEALGVVPSEIIRAAEAQLFAEAQNNVVAFPRVVTEEEIREAAAGPKAALTHEAWESETDQ